MALYDLILANKDEADLDSGHKRKKQGDIISIRPHGWKWGNLERKTHIIVTMDISDTLDNLQSKLICKSQAGDKRAYCVPLVKIQSLFPALDVGRMTDDKVDYQPILDGEICSARDQADIVWSKNSDSYVSPKDTIISVVG